MDILPYIVLLITFLVLSVKGTSLDRNELKIVVDTLYYTKTFSGVIKEEDREVSCTGLELHECYVEFNNLYLGHFHNTLVPRIYETIIEKLKKFNIVVLSLFDKIESINLPSQELEKIYSYIYFEDSKAYCPIDFLESLELLEIQVNDSLRDYIFFQIINKTGHGKDLKSLVYKHFENRKDELKDREFTDESISYKNILEQLRIIKNEINKYSQAFCDLERNLKRKWKTAEEWLWKTLNDSYTFNNILVDEENFLESKVHKIVTQGKSLKEMLDEQSQDVLFENITDNYSKINKMIDNYVLSVMCRKVISMIISDIKDSINRKTSVAAGQNTRSKQSTFISQAMMFDNALTFYSKLPNNTFDAETMSLASYMFTEGIKAYFLLFENPTDWNQLQNSVLEIEKYLSSCKNEKLQIDNNISNKTKDTSDNNLIKYNQEIKNINIVFARLIEVKLELGKK